MSNINRIGCELSKSARHDLRRAIRCMLIAASTLPLVYSGLTMGQESPYPPTNMGRVTVTADRYVPEPIITLATVRAVAFNPNSVSFYVDGVRMGDTFLGPVDTAGYDDGGNQGPVQQRNPQPDKPSCDGGGSKVGAMHAQVQNNPVDVTNGLKHVQETDFQSISNPELKLARYKNPLWKGSGILGQGWVTNLDLKLSFAGESGTCYPTPGAASCNVKNPSIISLYTEQGGIVQFTGGSGGYWQASNGSSISLVDGGKYRVRLRDSIFTPTMLFHSNGFVERVEQRDGNRLDFTYNSNKLTRVTHTSGRYIELRWSATTPSVVTTVVAPNNASFNYEYYYTGTRYASGLDSPILKRVSFPDGKGNVEYVHEEGYHTIHGAPQAYVHLHKILQVKVNGVALKKYTYHISGKVASSSFSDGSNLISYAYLSGKTESLNPYGKKTTYTISNDKITEVAGAASANCSATASFTSYNSNGQLEYTVDQSDVITRYEYDAYGRKKKQVEAAGTPEQRITTWEWDSDSANIFRTNLLKKMTVAGLVETSYEYLVGTIYDSAMPSAVVVKNLSANGVPSETRRTTYSYTFHSNGMVATVTEDGPMPGGGDAVVTSYNSSGDIISVQNSLGHRRVFSGHNGFGQPAKITNENGDATEYDYDARGRITTVREVVNGSPQSTVFSHDQFGRLNRIVAPDGRTFVREFDAAWRLIREYESESQGTYAQTRYSYDQASNVTSIVKERTTAVNPPAATPALTVPGVGVNGSFTISWTAVSGSESYTLEQSAAGGAWSSVYSGTSRSKSFSGMSAGSYAYRVKACNVAGCSAVSASGVVRIVYKPTASPVLTAPSQVTTGIYVVSWTSISGATSYNLEESTNNGAWSLIQNSALRTKSITGKTAATYRYRVAACNEAGCGPISAVATVLEVDPPTAIPIFTATPIVNTSGSYSIKWSSVSGAGSYMLEESAGGGGMGFRSQRGRYQQGVLRQKHVDSTRISCEGLQRGWLWGLFGNCDCPKNNIWCRFYFPVGSVDYDGRKIA